MVRRQLPLVHALAIERLGDEHVIGIGERQRAAAIAVVAEPDLLAVAIVDGGDLAARHRDAVARGIDREVAEANAFGGRDAAAADVHELITVVADQRHADAGRDRLELLARRRLDEELCCGGVGEHERAVARDRGERVTGDRELLDLPGVDRQRRDECAGVVVAHHAVVRAQP